MPRLALFCFLLFSLVLGPARAQRVQPEAAAVDEQMVRKEEVSDVPAFSDETEMRVRNALGDVPEQVVADFDAKKAGALQKGFFFPFFLAHTPQL